MTHETPAPDAKKPARKRLTLDAWIAEVGADPAKVAELPTAERAAIVALWRSATELPDIEARINRLDAEVHAARVARERLLKDSAELAEIRKKVTATTDA
jgi:hypothetical protein